MTSVFPVEFNNEFINPLINEEQALNLLRDYVHNSKTTSNKHLEKVKITRIQSSYTYLYTLETFYDERSIKVVENYMKGSVGVRPKTLEVIVYPKNLFVDEELKDILIPNSAKEITCQGCNKTGKTGCVKCDSKGFNQLVSCVKCNGNKIIRTLNDDGTRNNSPCKFCKFTGFALCDSCESGFIKCKKCDGKGIKRFIELMQVKYYSVKDEFYKVSNEELKINFLKSCRGERILYEQKTPCVNPLSNFKEAKINAISLAYHQKHLAKKIQRSPNEKFFINEEMSQIIAQKQEIFQIPVSKCDYIYENKHKSFYVVGLDQNVFIKDYPGSLCCTVL